MVKRDFDRDRRVVSRVPNMAPLAGCGCRAGGPSINMAPLVGCYLRFAAD